jgi:hypothetical protein
MGNCLLMRLISALARLLAIKASRPQAPVNDAQQKDDLPAQELRLPIKMLSRCGPGRRSAIWPKLGRILL